MTEKRLLLFTPWLPGIGQRRAGEPRESCYTPIWKVPVGHGWIQNGGSKASRMRFGKTMAYRISSKSVAYYSYKIQLATYMRPLRSDSVNTRAYYIITLWRVPGIYPGSAVGDKESIFRSTFSYPTNLKPGNSWSWPRYWNGCNSWRVRRKTSWILPSWSAKTSSSRDEMRSNRTSSSWRIRFFCSNGKNTQVRIRTIWEVFELLKDQNRDLYKVIKTMIDEIVIYPDSTVDSTLYFWRSGRLIDVAKLYLKLGFFSFENRGVSGYCYHYRSGLYLIESTVMFFPSAI